MKSIGTQQRFLIAIAGLITISWIVIAAFHPSGPASSESALTIGLLLGTMYGQTSLSAAWSALGPLQFMHRLPLSFAWLAMTVIALALNLATSAVTAGNELEVLLCVG